jgi:hypothetical protein
MDYEYEETANRQRALQGFDVMSRTSQSLARSQQAALETERIGTEVHMYGMDKILLKCPLHSNLLFFMLHIICKLISLDTLL